MCDLRHQRVVGIGVCEHRADGEQHYQLAEFRSNTFTIERITFGDCESRTPLVSQNVKADAAVRVDVGMVDTGGEIDLRRLERVVGREMDRKEENAARVWRVTLSCQPC